MTTPSTRNIGSPTLGAMSARLVTALACTTALAGCSTRTTNLATSAVTEPEAGPSDSAVIAPTRDSQITDALQSLPINEAGFTLCGDHVCACSNGKDDDTDQATDGFDPECTGSFDDDELTFASGVHGEDRTARCQDCYFDGNSGPGDDGCRRASSCASDGTPSSASGACGTCTPSTECVANCRPSTPNGCDCFGCCEVRTAEGVVNILLRDTCSLADIGDTAKCPRCNPATDCRNECGRCELCAGKTASDLPSDCSGSGAGGLDYTCDDGAACSLSQPCPSTHYCIQGCCVPIVI